VYGDITVFMWNALSFEKQKTPVQRATINRVIVALQKEPRTCQLRSALSSLALAPCWRTQIAHRSSKRIQGQK
jgi:hypothetical protein